MLGERLMNDAYRSASKKPEQDVDEPSSPPILPTFAGLRLRPTQKPVVDDWTKQRVQMILSLNYDHRLFSHLFCDLKLSSNVSIEFIETADGKFLITATGNHVIRKQVSKEELQSAECLGINAKLNEPSSYTHQIITKEQMIALAEAYDLGLHYGKIIKYNDRDGVYLSFTHLSGSEFSDIMQPLESSSKYKDHFFITSELFIDGGDPQVMLLGQKLKDLIEQCYGRRLFEQKNKSKPDM